MLLIKVMKIFIITILLFVTSCASLSNFKAKLDFEERLQYSTNIDKNLRSNHIPKKVEIIRAKSIEEFSNILSRISEELVDYSVLGRTKISTYNENYIVNENSLINLSKDNNCNLVVYFDKKDTIRYVVYKDNKGKVEKLKIINKKGHRLFEAYYFSKDIISLVTTKTINIK